MSALPSGRSFRSSADTTGSVAEHLLNQDACEDPLLEALARQCLRVLPGGIAEALRCRDLHQAIDGVADGLADQFGRTAEPPPLANEQCGGVDRLDEQLG